jgi:uncharacterized protein (TIGR00730 family)
LHSLCVFCGSSPGTSSRHIADARAFGTLLAREKLTLVYGGAHVGVMGALADAVLDAGGRTIGVIPHGLVAREVAHRGLTELIVVHSMHERKAEMAKRSDAFVALPGGLGTLEELFEVWTWALLGIHTKPVALLDSSGYYDALLAFIDAGVREGFVREAHRALLLRERDPERLLARLRAWEAPGVARWLEVSES